MSRRLVFLYRPGQRTPWQIGQALQRWALLPPDAVRYFRQRTERQAQAGSLLAQLLTAATRQAEEAEHACKTIDQRKRGHVHA
ncbi:hypothetical protein D3C78_1462870 [compost metagenome]